MIPVEVSDFSVDLGDQDLEDVVFWNSWHELEDPDFVLLLVHFFPHVSVGLFYADVFHNVPWYVGKPDIHVGSHQRNHASKGIAESLIQSSELLNEIETSLFELAELSH